MAAMTPEAGERRTAAMAAAATRARFLASQGSAQAHQSNHRETGRTWRNVTAVNILREVLRLVRQSPAQEDQVPTMVETTSLAQRLRRRPTEPGAGGSASSRVVELREFRTGEQVRGRDYHRVPGSSQHESSDPRMHARSVSENAPADAPAAIDIRTPRTHFQLWTQKEKIFVQTSAVAPELPEAVGEVLKAIDSLERVARMQSTDVRITGLVRGARDAIRAVGQRYQEGQRATGTTGPIQRAK